MFRLRTLDMPMAYMCVRIGVRSTRKTPTITYYLYNSVVNITVTFDCLAGFSTMAYRTIVIAFVKV